MSNENSLSDVDPDFNADIQHTRATYSAQSTPPNSAPSTPPKPKTQAQKDQEAMSSMTKSALNAVGSPDISNIEPRYFGYGTGAIAGPMASKLFRSISPENLKAAQIGREIKELTIPEMQAELERRKAALNPEPTQPTIEFKKPAGNPKYVQSMAGTGEQVPINLANSAVSMRSGDPTGMGAHDILDANARAANIQKKLVGGDYTLHTEGLVPSAQPQVPSQLYLPEGEKLPSQVLAEQQAAAKAARGVLGQAADVVGSKAGNVLDYGKLLLKTPLAKSIMRGANIVGPVVQAGSDIYNQDPTGLAIDAAQMGADIFGGPIGQIGGLLGGETARYLKDNPEVIKRIEQSPLNLGTSFATYGK